ncbi:fimbrial protein [Pseudomonas yamanorum]|jgi:major type 1 subunit fimbrin (pilin)|uniref:Fimbrial protein n=1 Tax=Pseudomonas yamanorum TaxID=515393 RepID=A0A143GHR6_9PSED|nr:MULTISPECIES: fimbrial protein [Pseudomonas]AMW83714.1 Putative fimbrial protein [Pseudomonas yamanorum]MBV6659625.1 type 1 fimbrial protein [Pseudomonas yamanorum]MDR0189006.1 fimbrial protein [Pseudomonas yamanorum]NVZ91760.1 type 1 fimbrial protein [Pseudomonas yamanorum]NWD40678.1 type 1 fimbrial protein [Pseudomonas yamanorum]
MNKFALKGLFAAVILAAGSQAAMAADGEINFVGSVTDNTCPVVVTDLNGSVGAGDVGLGDVPATSLATVGAVAGGGAFSLTIDTNAPGCSVTGKSAVVKFLSLSGTAGASGQWIGITPDAGHATNVAVQIKDATDRDVQLGLESAPYLDLTQPLRFTANYIATGIATSGPANAKAAFTVEYQ